MLTRAPMTTILPVVDMARAREFYEKRLGLGSGRAIRRLRRRVLRVGGGRREHGEGSGEGAQKSKKRCG